MAGRLTDFIGVVLLFEKVSRPHLDPPLLYSAIDRIPNPYSLTSSLLERSVPGKEKEQFSCFLF
jgi:hypothetical protein